MASPLQRNPRYTFPRNAKVSIESCYKVCPDYTLFAMICENPLGFSDLKALPVRGRLYVFGDMS